MRIAIVSDVHGNLVALEAVLAYLEGQRPDLVVHGGDLVLFGPQPEACLDRIRDLGWPGVLGNTDEVLWQPPPNLPFPNHQSVEWTRERLGPDRVDWLRAQPMEWRRNDDLALVHAAPGDLWRAVKPDAAEGEVEEVYGPLGAALVAYCHIHVPYVRRLPNFTIANSGSESIPLDGDPRPSYLLIEDGVPRIQRVDFDLERAAADVRVSGHPSADWIEGRMRRARAGG
jgi:predicted phosphodiesterase